MENMDKGLTVPKWVLINWPKIPQMPPKCFGPICLPKPKSLGFSNKTSFWVSEVRDVIHCCKTNKKDDTNKALFTKRKCKCS